jgi:uncharacterized membrane protein YqjE
MLFYRDFAAAYGTCWLILVIIAFATGHRVDAGAFGLYGFLAVGLCFAVWSTLERSRRRDP